MERLVNIFLVSKICMDFSFLNFQVNVNWYRPITNEGRRIGHHSWPAYINEYVLHLDSSINSYQMGVLYNPMGHLPQWIKNSHNMTGSLCPTK